MTTRDEVLDAIDRIEKAGGAGQVTTTARIELLKLPPGEYDRILEQLWAAYPNLAPPRRPPDQPAGQRGVGVEAMKRAEAALSGQQSTTAEFDRRVLEALRHAHKTTVDGRRVMAELAAQVDDAARSWDLSTATGAREFQRFLLAKLGQIMQVVEEANDDDASKRELAAALTSMYEQHADQPAPAPAEPTEPDPPAAGSTPDPDPLPMDEAEFDDAEPAWRSAPMPPAGPGFGGEVPGIGAMPGGGVPGGFPLGGLLQPQHRATPEPYPDDQADPAGEEASAGETADDDSTDGAGPAEPAPADPTIVTLPDGDTVRAATPQLAAVLQAAVGGTPIIDAFRRQGIAIPPPGTPVTAVLDQSRVTPGDVGMFTDRHALVLGNGKALLDGQIQRIANVRGPSFLGWQHPPTLAEPATAPTPIRPPAVPAQPSAQPGR